MRAIFLASCAVSILAAVDPERDFSGRWLLDRAASDLRGSPGLAEQALTIANRTA